MTREEHLLVILSEECAEVTQEVSKALRFGLDEKKPSQNNTNRERIASEFNDLYAVVVMLINEGTLKESDLLNLDAIDAKQRKVEKYLNYSKDVGKWKNKKYMKNKKLQKKILLDLRLLILAVLSVMFGFLSSPFVDNKMFDLSAGFSGLCALPAIVIIPYLIMSWVFYDRLY